MSWLLLILSAVLYALPFLLSDYCWSLIFIFPIPLLYVANKAHFSFIHGYVWGCAVFALHLVGGIYLIADMAGELWVVGCMFGVAMVLYQALVPAFLFWGVTKLITLFSIRKPLVRLFLWAMALWLFIMWVDWYSLWIFGVQEGYPLMHPLLLLAQKPSLLCLLPFLGKLLLTGIFLLMPMSIVALLWYKNGVAMLCVCMTVMFWWGCWKWGWSEIESMHWHNKIKSLPCMVCSTNNDPTVIIKIVSNHIKKIIACYPTTEMIIMPESACNVSNFAEIPELLQLWNKESIGKAMHVVFGASRWDGDNYYNSLHWVYDGNLQHCYDKRHAMLLSERLSVWMDHDFLKRMYFNERQPVTVSLRERIRLALVGGVTFVPYICSELFFIELPDDDCGQEPILAIINDSLFLASTYTFYIHKLLVLLARFKAIQWQRNIVYVSYAQSLFIDECGRCKEINV